MKLLNRRARRPPQPCTGLCRAVHRAEDGEVYIRRHATTQLYTPMELEEMRRVFALSK